MFAECYLISHTKTQSQIECLKIKDKQQLHSLVEVYQSPRFRESIQTNPKFIDNELLPQSRRQNDSLRGSLSGKEIQIVIVSPQAAALQTCLDLFAQKQGVDIYVEPLLQPQINCAANIPVNHIELLKMFKKEPFTDEVLMNKDWVLSYGNVKTQSPVEKNHNPHQQTAGKTNNGQTGGIVEIKPVGASNVHTEGNLEQTKYQQKCLQLLEKTGEFQTLAHFIERNRQFRRDLMQYVRKTKKSVAIVSHPQTLQALTATGWHQDGKSINSIPFNFGQVKRQHIWIEGVIGEGEEKSIPFCG